jgi:hypothetical protein
MCILGCYHIEGFGTSNRAEEKVMNEVRPMIRPLNSQGHPAPGGISQGNRPPTIARAPESLVDPLAANSAHVGADEPLTLVDDASVDAVAEHQKKIRSYDEGAKHRSHEWKREVHHSNTGATRVKSFHGKYSDQGLAYLDDAINEWLDGHPEADVKFVTSTVGMFDGKIKEPALVLNLWY